MQTEMIAFRNMHAYAYTHICACATISEKKRIGNGEEIEERNGIIIILQNPTKLERY